jgi:hypothetical protein
MLTVAQLRADFPEFADPSLYPDTLITFWLTVATTRVQNADRWATLLTNAQELLTAHYLVIAGRDRAASLAGATPGQLVGLQTAKAAADLSASYDYSELLIEGAGFWNQTTYGQRYFELAHLIGAGGIQIL